MPLIIEAPKPLTRLTSAIHRELSIVFFGTPRFAVPSLRLLREEGWPVAAVVTAPDKPLGRKRIMTPSPVRVAADELGIPVHTPETLKDDAFFPTFDALRPGLCIVVAYGKLIPHRYLEVPRLGFLNVHPSLLPKYRGPSPVQSAILAGETTTGVSIMKLDDEMDHGPVLAQRSWDIPSGFDAPTCEDELARLGADLLVGTMPGYVDGTVMPAEQDHGGATFCRKFTRDDGRILWSQPASRINDLVRALGANPGAWTTWDGRTFNIYRSSVRSLGPDARVTPGTVIRDGNIGAIVTGDGLLVPEEVQSEGGSRLPFGAFLNGHASMVGAILGS